MPFIYPSQPAQSTSQQHPFHSGRTSPRQPQPKFKPNPQNKNVGISSKSSLALFFVSPSSFFTATFVSIASIFLVSTASPSAFLFTTRAEEAVSGSAAKSAGRRGVLAGLCGVTCCLSGDEGRAWLAVRLGPGLGLGLSYSLSMSKRSGRVERAGREGLGAGVGEECFWGFESFGAGDGEGDFKVCRCDAGRFGGMGAAEVEDEGMVFARMGGRFVDGALRGGASFEGRGASRSSLSESSVVVEVVGQVDRLEAGGMRWFWVVVGTVGFGGAGTTFRDDGGTVLDDAGAKVLGRGIVGLFSSSSSEF